MSFFKFIAAKLRTDKAEQIVEDRRSNVLQSQQAVERLSELGAEGLIVAAQALHDKDYQIRDMAKEVLRSGGKDAARLLVKGLDNPHNVQRERVTEVLADIATPAEIDAMLEPLLDDEDLTVRKNIARALGQTRDRRAQVALVQALRDRQWEVRHAAALSLKKIQWQPISDVDRAFHRAALLQFEDCAKLGDASIEALAFYLTSRKEADSHRKRAVHALANCDSPAAVVTLRIAAADPFAEVRVAALVALCSHIPPVEVLPQIISELKDPTEEIGEQVIQALVPIGEPAVASLCEVLDKNSSSTYRSISSALEALGRIGGDRAMRALRQLVEDTDTNHLLESTDIDLILRALFYLAAGDWEANKKIIIGHLDHASPDVRYGALDAILSNDRAQAVDLDPIAQMLRDKAGMVRRKSAELLDLVSWKPRDDEEAAWHSAAQEDWETCATFGLAAYPVFERELRMARIEQDIYRHKQIERHFRPMTESGVFSGNQKEQALKIAAPLFRLCLFCKKPVYPDDAYLNLKDLPSDWSLEQKMERLLAVQSKTYVYCPACAYGQNVRTKESKKAARLYWHLLGSYDSQT